MNLKELTIEQLIAELTKVQSGSLDESVLIEEINSRPEEREAWLKSLPPAPEADLREKETLEEKIQTAKNKKSFLENEPLGSGLRIIRADATPSNPFWLGRLHTGRYIILWHVEDHSLIADELNENYKTLISGSQTYHFFYLPEDF
jgi:hypothetical protein